MRYIILKWGCHTTLVNEDTYEGPLSDYFVGSPEDAKKIGEVEIEGDTDQLGDIYDSQ